MNTQESFLTFNGRTISFQAVDGEFWIAVKPICEALHLEYTRQFKNLKEDEILSQLLAEQPMVGADNRIRKMMCLPEKFIYGWLFSIKSNSKELLEYKRKCYEILFNYFHGSITGRKELIKQKVEIDMELSKAEVELQENPIFTRIQNLKKKQQEINKGLRNNDKKAMQEAINLFTLSNN